MAKRGGSELTHENWDQEEEREDAGTFKKATEGDLKGRVIKRARRRNAGADEGTEKKNVFSGFGGFSAKQDSSQAFSFLAKPVEPEKPAAPAGGFVFGSVASAAAPAKPVQTSGFSFGSPSPGPAKPSFGAFGAETKSESPAPVFGSFTTDKSTSSPASTPLFGSKSDTAAPAATFGSFAFGAKKDSTPAAAAKTEESPPGSKSMEKTATAFGGGAFKFGGDTSGKSDSGTSSGLFSFGAAATKPTENKKVGDEGVGGGFSFGAPSSGEKPSGAAFSFGSTPTTEEKSDTGGFSFGTKQAETTKPFGSGFAFGGKSSESSSGKASPGFSFGEKSDTTATEKAPATSFAFGVKSDSEKQPIGGSFSFGSKTTAGSAAPAVDESDKSKQTEIQSGTKSVKAVTPIVSEDESPADDSEVLSTEYLSHLKALNVQVLAWLKQHIDSNPLVILSPVFKDYDKHLKEITDQYGTNKTTPAQEKSTSNTVPITISDSGSKPDPKPLGQAAFGNPKTSSSGSPFSFSTSDKPVNSTAPFSFGIAGQQSSLPNPVFGTPGGGFGAGGGFSFGAGGLGASATTTTSDTQGSEGAKEEDEEDQPPVVEVKQVEESDAIYDKKCKLFYKKDDRYVEKGVGMLYLKSVEGGKTQLLVRADTNLGNVLLNILLNPQIPTTRVGKNNVMLVCVPNPPVDPKADTSAPCPMLLRVKNGDDADELKAKLDELKAEN